MINDATKKLYTVNPDKPDDPDGIRDYFTKIIEAMPNNVYWLNRDCITMGCNKNTLNLIGLKKLEDFVGITYEEMGKLANWTEGQAQSFKRDDIEVMETGKPKINVEEPPLYDKNGELVYYISSRVPLFDQNQNVIGVLGISVDITERKKLEKNLVESQIRVEKLKALSSMGGMIAHELRTPLIGVTFGMRALENMLNKLTGIYKSWSTERNETPIPMDRVNHLSDIYNDIRLSLTQIDNTINTVLAGFKPNSIAKNKLVTIKADDLFKKLLETYPLTDSELELITISYNKKIELKCIPQIVIHILMNLVKNSLYHIQEANKGEIHLWASQEANLIKIHVKDTAKGISQENLLKIFEPFFTTKDSATSIGMGLYFCKLAIESMGGQITCESIEGKYTQFTLSITH